MANSSVDPAVRCVGLTVVRGDVAVLADLTLDVAPGLVTGLQGPSGAVKTTLHRSVVGTQVVRSGTVTVLGHAAGSPAVRHTVGYATQSAAVYDDLTVRENVRYFAATLGLGRTEVDRVIAQVDLEAYADRVAVRLSGGQRSRVSLAVALLGRPRLLVLDEPTVGLDPVLREQLWALFRGLADDGAALLVSSHVMDEAERCDELLLLRDGRLIAQETPASLRARTGTDSMDRAFLALVEGAAA
jgi:ABC-2 type transport system ATP-binding protein